MFVCCNPASPILQQRCSLLSVCLSKHIYLPSGLAYVFQKQTTLQHSFSHQTKFPTSQWEIGMKLPSCHAWLRVYAGHCLPSALPAGVGYARMVAQLFAYWMGWRFAWFVDDNVLAFHQLDVTAIPVPLAPHSLALSLVSPSLPSQLTQILYIACIIYFPNARIGLCSQGRGWHRHCSGTATTPRCRRPAR